MKGALYIDVSFQTERLAIIYLGHLLNPLQTNLKKVLLKSLVLDIRI